MSIGIAPRYSKKRVTRAGNKIRSSEATAEDLEVLENWRAAHSHVMNTFQTNLRRRSRGSGYLVGQRLKRRVTIIDKLNRESGMNLSRMHDIAGCRVVFPNMEDLIQFRAAFIESRAEHERLTAERDQLQLAWMRFDCRDQRCRRNLAAGLRHAEIETYIAHTVLPVDMLCGA